MNKEQEGMYDEAEMHTYLQNIRQQLHVLNSPDIIASYEHLERFLLSTYTNNFKGIRKLIENIFPQIQGQSPQTITDIFTKYLDNEKAFHTSREQILQQTISIMQLTIAQTQFQYGNRGIVGFVIPGSWASGQSTSLSDIDLLFAHGRLQGEDLIPDIPSFTEFRLQAEMNYNEAFKTERFKPMLDFNLMTNRIITGDGLRNTHTVRTNNFIILADYEETLLEISQRLNIQI